MAKRRIVHNGGKFNGHFGHIIEATREVALVLERSPLVKKVNCRHTRLGGSREVKLVLKGTNSGLCVTARGGRKTQPLFVITGNPTAVGELLQSEFSDVSVC